MRTDATTRGKTWLLGACALLLSACAAIPYQSPEDVARIQHDLHLAQAPTAMLPLKWSYLPYGSEEGVQVKDAVALVQPGLLTLIGYENGQYLRQAEFASSAVDCAYLFEGADSLRPVWLLLPERGVYLGTTDDRGTINQALRQQLINNLRTAGFRLHSDADGKAYQMTGESDRRLVLQPGYGMRAEKIERGQAFNVCR